MYTTTEAVGPAYTVSLDSYRFKTLVKEINLGPFSFSGVTGTVVFIAVKKTEVSAYYEHGFKVIFALKE